RHELDQILVALVGLGEEHEVIRLGLWARLLEAASLRDVDLAAEDRLDAALARMVVKDHRRKHVAVLGHRECGHLQPGRFVQQLVDAARAVKQRELGVKMQVNKLVHASTFSLLCSCSRSRYSHSIVEGGFDDMS